MGNYNATYKNGDLPRYELGMNGIINYGSAYYKSSEIGACSKCSTPTYMWYVSVKERGNFVCQNCFIHNINFL